jgi:hypothetical protein
VQYHRVVAHRILSSAPVISDGIELRGPARQPGEHFALPSWFHDSFLVSERFDLIVCDLCCC